MGVRAKSRRLADAADPVAHIPTQDRVVLNLKSLRERIARAIAADDFGATLSLMAKYAHMKGQAFVPGAVPADRDSGHGHAVIRSHKAMAEALEALATLYDNLVPEVPQRLVAKGEWHV